MTISGAAISQTGAGIDPTASVAPFRRRTGKASLQMLWGDPSIENGADAMAKFQDGHNENGCELFANVRPLGFGRCQEMVSVLGTTEGSVS